MTAQNREDPELLDHIGWALWQAAQTWKRRFSAEMVALGYSWYGEARAAVLAHLDRDGTRQAELTARMGLSKQAVQQLVDGLVADGVVERVADPADGRGRVVRYTAAGLDALRDANRVKQSIEDDYRRTLGAARFRALRDALALLRDDDGARRP